MTDQLAIVTDGLTKRYGNTLAVDDLSFAVPEGIVYGFLGLGTEAVAVPIALIRIGSLLAHRKAVHRFDRYTLS